jgi:hypothetical protein
VPTLKNVELNMTSLILADQVGFSKRSVDSLVDVVKVLRKDDDLPLDTDLSLETARAIKYIFDSAAWSDGQLNQEEIKLLHDLLSGHEWLRNAYFQVEASEPRASGLYKIPNLLFLAMDHDERMKTHYAQMLVNALEMIAYGVVAADGNATPDELSHFRHHISTLREFTRLAR